MWETLLKQKKPFMFWDDLVDWTTTRWAFTDMVKRIGKDEWLYTLVHYDASMSYSPYSPFDHIVVNNEELEEYFEQIEEKQRQ